MRFLVTMNMPSYSGNLVHQMIVDHNANSLEEFTAILKEEDFIIVEEMYKNPNDGSYYSRGDILLNHQYIGKVKVFNNTIKIA